MDSVTWPPGPVPVQYTQPLSVHRDPDVSVTGASHRGGDELVGSGHGRREHPGVGVIGGAEVSNGVVEDNLVPVIIGRVTDDLGHEGHV